MLAQQGGEDQLHLVKRQSGPDAATGAATEGEEFARAVAALQKPLRPEDPGIGVELGALVHRLDAAEEHIAGLEGPAGHLQGFLHQAGEEKHRHRMDAQHLVDHGAEIRKPLDPLGIIRILAGGQLGQQPLAHLALAMDPVHGPGEHGGAGFVAGEQQGEQFVVQLGVAEALSAFRTAGEQQAEHIHPLRAIAGLQAAAPVGDLLQEQGPGFVLQAPHPAAGTPGPEITAERRQEEHQGADATGA